MRLANVRRSFGALGLLLFTAAALGAQPSRRPIASPGPTRAANPQRQRLWTAFGLAIRDAAVYQRANVRKLRPLSPDPDSVTVATLTTDNDTVGTLKRATLDGIWVTGDGEVRDICRRFRGDILLWLQQPLGLPPTTETAHVLVLRALATDVFRPSRDARIGPAAFRCLVPTRSAAWAFASKPGAP